MATKKAGKKTSKKTSHKVSKKTTKRAPASKAKKSGVMPKRHYEGPAQWLIPMLEEAYTELRPKEEAEAEAARPARKAAAKKKAGGKLASTGKKLTDEFVSSFQEGKGEAVLADLPQNYWKNQFEEFHKRRTQAAK